MKVTRTSGPKGPGSAKKAPKSTSGDGSFVESLKETGVVSGDGAAPEITGVAGVEGILAAQNTAEPVADQRRRQRLMAYGDDLLERLDDLRIGILLGRFSKEKPGTSLTVIPRAAKNALTTISSTTLQVGSSRDAMAA